MSSLGFLFKLAGEAQLTFGGFRVADTLQFSQQRCDNIRILVSNIVLLTRILGQVVKLIWRRLPDRVFTRRLGKATATENLDKLPITNPDGKHTVQGMMNDGSLAKRILVF